MKNQEQSKSFLQSEEWQKFQESLNRKTWRIDDRLVIRHNLPLGRSYLYCPRSDVSNIFLIKVKDIAKQENSIFLKIEPELFEVRPLQKSDFKQFMKSSRQIQPSKTIILDISKSEDELLSSMHKKTRYNIRLAKKKGVKVVQSSDRKSLDAFLRLLKKTSKRDNFSLHPDKYYVKMMETLGGGMIKLFLAKHKNKVIAANLICFFNKTAVYLHGSSDYEYRQLMAPYLLQWQIIKQAKENNLKYYDFWGIDEDKLPGVTRFKKGFNGEEINYPGTYDLVYNKLWYWAYKAGRKIL